MIGTSAASAQSAYRPNQCIYRMCYKLRPNIRHSSTGASDDGDGNDDKKRDDKSIEKKKEELSAKGEIKSYSKDVKDKLKGLLNSVKVAQWSFSTKETITPQIARPAPELRNKPIPPPEELLTEDDKKEKELDDATRDRLQGLIARMNLKDRPRQSQTLMKEDNFVNEYDEATKERLQSLLKVMKIDFEKKPPPFEYDDFMRPLARASLTQKRPVLTEKAKDTQKALTIDEEPIGLFVNEKGKPFFKDTGSTIAAPTNTVWRRLDRHEVELMATPPPTNAWEEMIRWTEQGKLWKFPIDNEAGLDEEAQVPFYEHVMLDHKLEGFPKTGAVRIFMEKVLLGLTNNPYMTVKRKHEIIDWYKNYFKSKADLFHLAGVQI